MSRSIITGLGVLAVVTALLLWLAGVYEMSSAGALALGFIGFVFTILFARFGGFKPFFPVVEPGDSAESQSGFNGRKIWNLVGVGAESTASESLFAERTPVTPPPVRTSEHIFPDAEDEDEEPNQEQHPPLFTEALTQQLATERPTEEHIRWVDDGAGHVHPVVPQPSGFVESLQADRGADESVGDIQGREPLADTDELDADELDAGEADTDEIEVEAEDAPIDSDADVDLEDLDAEELAASLDELEPANPSEAAVEVDYVTEPMVMESTGLAVTSGTELPVVVETPAALELHKYSSSEIMSVVKNQEGLLVDTLIDEGVLSTSGPITDKDIRTMVFVAVSSNELIDVLTQAQRDAVALNGGSEHALGTGD
jgi:hypothetical protein